MISARSRYIRDHYRQVLNLPFHQRLAQLHRQFEQDAQRRAHYEAEATAAAARAAAAAAQDPAAVAARNEALRRMYRTAVSTPVRRRGPPIT